MRGIPFLLSLALSALATGQSFEVAVIRPHAPGAGTILDHELSATVS